MKRKPDSALRTLRRVRPRTTAATALRNYRRARTMNQADIARILGVGQPTYSKYESGVIIPPDDQQQRLAAILGVSVEMLFGANADNGAPQSGAA